MYSEKRRIREELEGKLLAIDDNIKKLEDLITQARKKIGDLVDKKKDCANTLNDLNDLNV